MLKSNNLIGFGSASKGPEMKIISSFSSGNMTNPKGLALDGTEAYVAGQTSDSITSVDISDTSSMTELDTYTNTTLNGASDVKIHGTVAFVVAMVDDSITSVDIATPGTLSELDTYKPGTSNINGPEYLAINSAGTYAYVSSTVNDRLVIIDISPATSMFSPGSISTARTNYPQGIDIDGDDLYMVSRDWDGISSYDISTPTTLTFQDGITSGTRYDGPSHVKVSGNFAFVISSSDDMLTVVDIADPGNISTHSFITDSVKLNSPNSLGLKGNVAYVHLSSGSLVAIDITDLTNMKIIHKLDSGEFGGSSEIEISGTTLFVVCAASDKLVAVDISEVDR